MSYRLPQPSSTPPSPSALPKSLIIDDAVQSYVSVDNGTISRIPIPCFYRYRNDSNGIHRMMHDHLGWPSPGSPDASCQIPGDLSYVMEPIDLAEEGYNAISVSMVSPPSGLTVTGEINFNIVTLVINAMCSNAASSDIEVKIAVYATGQKTVDGRTIQLRDVVTKGMLRIVAGPIS